MSIALPRGAELRVADVVRRAAAERGGAVALRHGARAITYRELDERSNRLAQALLASGVRPGARVAHLDRTGPEVVELLFAASKIGAVLVPLNWRLAVAELARVVADARPPVLVAGRSFGPAAAALAAGRRAARRRGRRRLRGLAAGSTSRSIRAGAATPMTPCCRCTRRARPGRRRAS